MSEETRDIETALERERVALAESLVALRDRLSPSALLAEGKAALKDQARPYVAPLVEGFDGAVRGKPVAAIVAGLALATLVLGRKRGPSDIEAASAVPAMAGTRFEALTRWEDEGGPPAPEPVDPEEDWLHEARGLRQRAQRLLAQIDDAARRGLAPAKALARHRADVLAALARDTSAALGKGLGSLNDTARAQALQARERVYVQKLILTERGREAVLDHPVAWGAAAAALGAGAAWLFPVTEAENRLMGQARDRMLADLNAAVRSEVAGASEAVQTLTSALGRDIRRVQSTLRPEHGWTGADSRTVRPH